MQDQRIAGVFSDGCLSDEHLDCAVLHFMLYDEGWPWTIEEIGRELGHEGNAHDAVRRLTAAGLVHGLGDFVFPTRTARRARELQVGTG